MAEGFTILLLSDTHIGKPDTDIDSLDVLRPLLSDIRTIVKKQDLHIDTIVFAGDLAFGQLPDRSLAIQYEKAKEFLSELCAAAGSEYGKLPILYAPGNHDINRDAVDEGQRLWVDRLRTTGEDAVDNVARTMRENSTTWRRILERQSVWWEFVKRIPGPWSFNDDLYLSYGELDTECGKFGIAALNTSWASYMQRESGDLWLGRHQLQVALDNLQGSDYRIAVTHHPISWLNEAERTTIDQKIESHFKIHLHGHDHTAWFKPLEGHLTVASGAAYQGATKDNGYCFLNIKPDEKAAYIYLRQYSDSGAGGWIPRIIPNKKCNGEGVYVINNLFIDDESGEIIGDALVNPAMATSTPTESPDINPEFAHWLRLNSSEQSVNSIREYVTVLENSFNFRWEPSSYRETAAPVVYWPVRLRPPTPIHAVQAFAAAGLKKLGADIVLCIDDLGKKDYTVDLLVDTLDRWLKHVGGDEAHIEIRTFSEIVGTTTCEEAWSLAQSWLGKTEYLLDKVLEISKLYAEGDEIKDILVRRPRRLLNPAVIWACLVNLSQGWQNRPVITLGGYDEYKLWQAWRECVTEHYLQMGHLYIPELKKVINEDRKRTLHMATTPLNWTSRDDIRQYLSHEVANAQDNPILFERVPVIPWLITLCVLLPQFISSSRCLVQFIGEIEEGVSDNTVIDSVVSAAGRWLFT